MSTGGQSLRAEDSPVVNTLRDWPSAPENKLSLHKKLSLVIQSPFKTGTSGICANPLLKPCSHDTASFSHPGLYARPESCQQGMDQLALG
ncbi:hypothetical protein AV530_017187 [Patagioenas fasciata monilis]|uniref:Uncharacterized protein n=1 Tax=Patagioenas fasciata monilis TaxID=372326 RepID=A0A1V4JFA2_PATFA|nr:hypothetical protein AV530_017187 [Patagioenas fasciata monilis]